MNEDRRIDRPEPGFFKMKLVKNGPWVPALIFLPCPIHEPYGGTHPDDWGTHRDRSRQYRAIVAGEEADVLKVWTWGKKIAQSEHDHLVQVMEWAIQHAPHAPEAMPKQAIKLENMKSLF